MNKTRNVQMINVIRNKNGWTNSFQLQVSYDIEFVTDIFNVKNTVLIENLIYYHR
jgi:hypothetical protein